MKKVLLLGCSGSIGLSTLDIINLYKNDFVLTGLQAHTNEKFLLEQESIRPGIKLCLSGKEADSDRIQYSGSDGILKLIEDCEADIVVNGIVGASGLAPTIRAITNGRDVALANKESMVLAGPLINHLASVHKCKLIPVDSEHSALFHLFHRRDKPNVAEIILTASGGPFRNLPIEKFSEITLADALKHPTWDMGKKITIDSATMANKGLEIIEAQRIFDFDIERIKVLIHPQSYVHSLIRTEDMALYAQISAPDMRLPIQNALYYPEMKEVPWTYLDLAGKTLEFQAPDFKRFPMMKMAYDCAELENGYPIAYNGANEIAVEAYLKDSIHFMDIARITEETLNHDWSFKQNSFDQILETDRQTRETASRILKDKFS
jgi:1-deoxy-D-xylulose-5-phosphate reductoisomerase